MEIDTAPKIIVDEDYIDLRDDSVKKALRKTRNRAVNHVLRKYLCSTKESTVPPKAYQNESNLKSKYDLGFRRSRVSFRPYSGDQSLVEKYSLLKLPWKTNTSPICSEVTKSIRPTYRNKIVDNNDSEIARKLYNKKTEMQRQKDYPEIIQYIYDSDDSEDSDSKQNVFQIQNFILFVAGTVCGICLVSSIWIILKNSIIPELFISPQTDFEFKKYVKLFGRTIIFTITYLIKGTCKLFMLPAHQIHQCVHYHWSPIPNAWLVNM
ncbi:uncharacterized protein LOC132699091 [Cylas formicarius]|uniref:uncharacterized protein LOC132699091 n=1 Tax=Cylas formicarius TaxID=197179 RepID=UPI0029588313|nr:uncharacterized protein LOC132699091 [Cylas formicarius]